MRVGEKRLETKDTLEDKERQIEIECEKITLPHWKNTQKRETQYSAPKTRRTQWTAACGISRTDISPRSMRTRRQIGWLVVVAVAVVVAGPGITTLHTRWPRIYVTAGVRK